MIIDLTESDEEQYLKPKTEFFGSPSSPPLMWNNCDTEKIMSKIISPSLLFIFNIIVSATEAKLWLVPRIDTRNMDPSSYSRSFIC